jgi:hypothetical protein
MLHSAGAVATVPGVGLYARGRPSCRRQWQGWRPAGLTPGPNPVKSRESKSRVQTAPPSRARRVSRTGVGGAASRDWHRPRRTVPHSGGDGFPPRELVQQKRGVSPRRMMAPLGRCQNIKCPYPAYGNGRARAECPRARRSPLEGGADPRARRSPLEVSAPPRMGRSPPEGGVCPRARRSLLEGIFKWAALVGRQGHRGVGHALCV